MQNAFSHVKFSSTFFLFVDHVYDKPMKMQARFFSSDLFVYMQNAWFLNSGKL
jgi:hypothetical protein